MVVDRRVGQSRTVRGGIMDRVLGFVADVEPDGPEAEGLRARDIRLEVIAHVDDLLGAQARWLSADSKMPGSGFRTPSSSENTRSSKYFPMPRSSWMGRRNRPQVRPVFEMSPMRYP